MPVLQSLLGMSKQEHLEGVVSVELPWSDIIEELIVIMNMVKVSG